MSSSTQTATKGTKPDLTQRHVVFLAVPPITELDLLGPINAFALAGSTNGTPLTGGKERYRITIATTSGDMTVTGQSGITMSANRYFLDVTEPIDTLLVVGGGGARQFDGDPAVCGWLRECAGRSRRVGSVCTGAFILASAGLLDGGRATTHWSFADDLARRFPKVTVDPDSIWVKQGNVYTSAGVTAGIDLALAMIEEDLGSQAALHVARLLVVFLKRPGGQRQFSAALDAQTPRRPALTDLLAWMTDHLDQTLSVEVLADKMAMSARNFARVFRDEMGVAPAAYVRQRRLGAARLMLEQTDRGLSDIAARCGFGSEEVMRRAFLDEFDTTPGQYRRTFATSARG